ncbi:MAG TPA: sugar nucleotide-binding protein [Gaiellaceae bacterium]|nr:sugar nucleotide-binding protein [Gaiellaceae bacterium]
MELWGGIECTYNRVGDRWFDQLELNGHRHRLDDLDLFAELGLRTIRYPVLWERAPDWGWVDERLGRLRELGIRPIVGLCHHGSGPAHTNLLDYGFAAGLAEHAAEVAERYPWLELWTPVNEPNTTARFSALYGHWYPHARDDRSYARAVTVQCRATVLAMEAVRRVNPDAQLVQTEDLGRMHATPPLRYQADLENERRWLSFDLLTGTLDLDGAVATRFADEGFDLDEFEWLLDRPCPPDMLGINHYLSGERILDHRLDRYDACWHGGNGLHAYADDVAPAELREGPAPILRAAWERYRLPLAVTEVHNGLYREEQLRWLVEVWRAAEEARAEGADVRAVTVWSFLGTYDWDRLCTGPRGFYEAGVHDVRGPRPRPTALAAAAAALAGGVEPAHPVLEDRGWWRADRLPLRGRPVVFTGATGTLGQAFAAAGAERNLSHRLLRRAELDIADEASVVAALDELRPWAVVNTAGYVRVDDAEADAARCMRENAVGPEILARACAARGIGLVTFSSDLVFDGLARRPYVESDAVAPLNVYGASKAAAEELVLAAHDGALVVRTSAFFGPTDAYNFVTRILEELAGSGSATADALSVVSPTYVPDLVHAVLDLLVDGESGIWHLASRGAVTWHELAARAAAAAGLDPEAIEASPPPVFPARRPLFSALGSERGELLPTLDDALERYTLARARRPNAVAVASS